MNHASRAKLNAAGLPIGDSATARQAGGRIRYGGGGDSSSSSTSAPSDRRLVAAPDSIGITGDGNSANLTTVNRQKTGGQFQVDTGNIGNGSSVSIVSNTTDAGSVKAAFDFAETSTRSAERTNAEALGMVSDAVDVFTSASRDTTKRAFDLVADQTGAAFDAISEANRNAIRFADNNDERFMTAVSELSGKAIRTAEKAQSDVVGAYQNAADTSSGARQTMMIGGVLAGIVAIAALAKRA